MVVLCKLAEEGLKFRSLKVFYQYIDLQKLTCACRLIDSIHTEFKTRQTMACVTANGVVAC